MTSLEEEPFQQVSLRLQESVRRAFLRQLKPRKRKPPSRKKRN
jgi:hypothetical protein